MALAAIGIPAALGSDRQACRLHRRRPTTSRRRSRPKAILRRLNETLEQRIAERTAQLRNPTKRKCARIFETSHQYQGLLNSDGDLLYANRTSLNGIRANAIDVIGTPYGPRRGYFSDRRNARHCP